tara:strand:- start:8124 stop:8804 length:681 start_codon:yes stop_codon:yes gene_type:complete
MQGESNSARIAPAERKRRGGRPTAAQAGDVDRRLLESAQRLFLAQGFDRTNCEQVAAEAGAGKASLYARYANKQELFTAVVLHSVNSMLAHNIDPVPPALPVSQRLARVGSIVLGHALQPNVVALMRVVITTAYRFPELANLTNAIGRDRGIALAARAIAGEQAGTADALDRALPAATKFIDIIFVPFQMRALLGEDLAALAAESPRAVDEAVALLAAGGWLEDWH